MLNSCKVRRNTQTREIDQVVIYRPFTDERANVIYNYYRSVGIPIHLGKEAMRKELEKRGFNVDLEVAAINEGVNQPRIEPKDYRYSHTAPNADNTPLHDLTMAYGDDIYTDKAYYYFGDGNLSMDKKSASILQSLRGKPKAKVTVYRAVPKGVTEINSGDWVSINRDYAIKHGEGHLDGEYDILSKDLTADQIFTDGNSMHEQGVQFLSTTSGEVYGFITPEGEMFLDPDIAGVNTLIHEGAHIQYKVLKTAAERGDVKAQAILNKIQELTTPAVETIFNTKKAQERSSDSTTPVDMQAEQSIIKKMPELTELANKNIQIIKDYDRYQRILQKQAEGRRVLKTDQAFLDSHPELKNPPILDFGTPSDILMSVGITNPIKISMSHINRKLVGKEAHELTLLDLQDLMRAIHNPATVNKGAKGRVQLLTNHTNSNGAPIVVVLDNNYKKNTASITTAYALNNLTKVVPETSQDVLYTNNKRLADFLSDYSESKNRGFGIALFSYPEYDSYSDTIKYTQEKTNPEIEFDIANIRKIIENTKSIINKTNVNQVDFQIERNQTSSIFDLEGNLNIEELNRIVENNLITTNLTENEKEGLRRASKYALGLFIISREAEKKRATDGQELVEETTRRAIEDYSRAQQKIWSQERINQNYDYFSEGSEAVVYKSKDGTHVLKQKNVEEIELTYTPTDFIKNRVILYNTLFPDSTYEIVGITEQGDFLLKQDFVEGKTLTELFLDEEIQTREEVLEIIDKEVKRRFEVEREDRGVYFTKDYIIADISEYNIVQTTDGRFIIDAITVTNNQNRVPLSIEIEQDLDFQSTMVRDKRQTDTGLEYNLGHEVQHVISEIEGFPKGGDYYSVLKEAVPTPQTQPTIIPEVLSSPAYNQREGETDEQYKERLREEVFARALGDNGEQYLKDLGFTAQEAKTFLQKVQEFLAEIVDWLRGKKGLQDLSVDEINKLSIREFLDRSTTSMMLGEFKNEKGESRVLIDKVTDPTVREFFGENVRGIIVDGIRVGTFIVEEIDGLPNVVRVISIKEEERQKGIAKEAYLQYVRENGEILSGQFYEEGNEVNSFFSEDAKRLWDSLKRDYNVEVISLYNYKRYKLSLKNNPELQHPQTAVQGAIQRNNGHPLHLAPNGQPSILYQSYRDLGYTEQQAEELKAQVYSDNFIDWFGDWINDPQNASKVVDENGEPLVVYHGTEAEFTEFEPTKPNFYQETEGWYFFTDKKESAKTFGKNVMPVFLNIDNPTIETTGHFNTWNLYDDEGNYGFIAPNTDTGNGGVANQYVVENPNQIKSATDNVGTFSSESNNINFQIIGTQGAQALDAAEQTTERMDNLAVALEMEAAGKTPQDIRLATGWEQGADGKWRYEIDDSIIDKNISNIPTITVGNRYTYKKAALSEILSDSKDLFTAYPYARDIEVVFYDFNHPDGTRGTFREKNSLTGDTITLWGVDFNQLSDSNVSTILHEVQHYIQTKESFAEGGNTRTVREGQILNKEWEDFHSTENQSKYKEYVKLRNSEKYTKELLESNEIFESRYNNRITEIHNDSSLSLTERIEALDSILKEFENYSQKNFPTLRRVDEIANNYIVREPKKYVFGFEGYRSLVGEVEARNVQTRMNMTPQQRRETLLQETEDVPRANQLLTSGTQTERIQSEQSIGSDIQGIQVLEYQGSTLSYKQRVNPITNQPTNQIEIDLISVPQENRNQGHARELLRRMTEIADSRGQELYLFAAPRDRTTTTEGLIKLYKEFGFESISPFLPEEMVRPARRDSQRVEESLVPTETLYTEDIHGVQEYVPANNIITYYSETGEINYKRNSEGDLVMLKTVSATPQQEESITYQQLLSIPNLSKEQALEAYKNLYSTKFYDWNNKTNECN